MKFIYLFVLSVFYVCNVHCEIIRPGAVTAKLSGYGVAFHVSEFGKFGGASLASVISSDLKIHGEFALASINSAEAAKLDQADLQGGIKFQNWKNLGIEILVKGTASASGFEVKAYHTTGSAFMTKTYNGSPSIGLAHQIANDIVLAYTKVPGFFDTRIIFTMGNNKAKNVYMCDASGLNRKQLTTYSAITTFPAWYPGGKQILFTSYHYEGHPIMYKLDLTTAKITTLLAFPGMNQSGAVSRDGKMLSAVLDKDGRTEIYIFDIASSARKRLTTSNAAKAAPCFSPNGRQIAYTSDQGGKTPQVYIMGSGGGNASRISQGRGDATSPDWSPDGKKIAFAAKVGGAFEIHVYDVATKQISQITQQGSHMEHPTWASDSRHLVCAKASGSLVIVDSETGKTTTILNGSFVSTPAFELK